MQQRDLMSPEKVEGRRKGHALSILLESFDTIRAVFHRENATMMNLETVSSILNRLAHICRGLYAIWNTGCGERTGQFFANSHWWNINLVFVTTFVHPCLHQVILLAILMNTLVCTKCLCA